MKQLHSLPKILVILGMAASAITATVSQAANVNYAGNIQNNGTTIQRWRDATSGKPMDIDGDNIWGTAGYVMFGTGYASYAGYYYPWSSYGNNILNTPGTLVSLPAGMTLANGWNTPNVVFGDSWYPQIQDPANTANLIRLGGASRSVNGTGGTGQSWLITMGTNTPGVGNAYAKMRVAFLLWNPQGQASQLSGPTSIRLITSASDTGNVTNSTTAWGQGLMFFDITNYSAGDQVQIWLNNTNSGAMIQGMTFDVALTTAKVSYAGTVQYNDASMQRWRDTTVAKPLDIDGDNVWGTAGYVMFGTGFTSYNAQFSFPFGDILQTDGTLANMPTDMSLKLGWLPPTSVIADGWFPTIQDPANTNNLISLGVAHNGYTGIGESYIFTMGTNTPGVGNPNAKMRVAFFVWQPSGQWWGTGATTIRLQTPNGSTGDITNQTPTWGRGLMLFDISNYSVGDQVQVWLNGATTNAVVQGMTFDVMAQVAPTSLQPLSITNSAGIYKITWPAPSFGTAVLQSATNVSGPYSSVVGATSPYTILMTNNAAFFRTIWTNP